MTSTHERALELLPWLVNGTLDAGEEASLREHLGGCAECREQLELLREVGGAVRDARHPRTDALAALETMRGRMEPREARRTPGGFSPLARRVVLVQAAALALTVGLLLFQRGETAPSAEFRTLSEVSETSATSHPRARVLFVESATEREIRELLRGAGARVVDGPTEMGLYTLELDERRGRAEARLEELGRSGIVRFVGPAADSEPSADERPDA